MLVVTRKQGEAVLLGEDIEVVVVGIEGNQVRLGFQAPASVVIHRKELYERIQRANREALADKESPLPKLPSKASS